MDVHQVTGGEVRKLHIIYFLSRDGRTEHPHLIRLRHLSRLGLRLRDVKRWLGELRGKELAESFAWSYKRKYKKGYVWEDVGEDDVLTPISDNEYVLKGSQIASSTPTQVVPMQKKNSQLEEEVPEDSKLPLLPKVLTTDQCNRQPPIAAMNGDDISTKTSSEIEQEGESPVERPSSLHPMLAKKQSSDGGYREEKKDRTPPENSKSRSGARASNIFRNFITCGAVETKDSAVLPVSRRRLPRAFSVSVSDKEVCKVEKVGGSQRIYGTKWNREHHSKPRKNCDGLFGGGRQPFSGGYKYPNCSQCGKPFNPEKLHSHMKSCKGMKNWGKSTNPVSSAPKEDSKKSTEPSVKNSVSVYCLTH